MSIYKTEKFISKSKEIYGNRYSYTRTIYFNAKTKVIITCPIHGDFDQLPWNHYRYGCFSCGGSARKTTAQFITQANSVHNNSYDYQKVIYKNNSDKVQIFCPIHGLFEQSPVSHLSGIGCPQCGNRRQGDLKFSNTFTFAQKAHVVHNYFYDYSEVIYKRASQKVQIICPKHGDFLQTPNKHLSGGNCPGCNRSKGEEQIMSVLKDLKFSAKEQYRIADCKNKKPLPFDVGVFGEDRLLGLIEFQGKQHYEPIARFGGKDNFIKTTHNDKIKKTYCLQNNIPLLIIAYWNRSEVDSIVRKFILALRPTL